MTGKLFAKLIVQTVVWLALTAAVLFGAAGTWRWVQGWAFIVLFASGSLLLGLWLGPRDPALLEARLNPPLQKQQPWWDKIFLIVFISFWFVWFAVMSADAVRFHWSPPVPIGLNVVGGLLIFGGFVATMSVFSANSFAAPVVRVQEERKQYVIDTGPYAYVRHPMYACAILYLFGMPLLLGSRWGLIGSAIFVVGVSFRSVGEEQTLKRELVGYDAYMQRVRYRLIPGVF